MGRHPVCPSGELKPGQSKIVTLEGKSIGVYNVKNVYYAIRNRCPHQGAELCLGHIQGIMLPSAPGKYEYGMDGEIVRCPWHGWEFDIKTGQSVFDPFKCRVRAYEVDIVGKAKLAEGNPAADAESAASAEEWPEVETFPVSVEVDWVVVTV